MAVNLAIHSLSNCIQEIIVTPNDISVILDRLHRLFLTFRNQGVESEADSPDV